MRFEMKLTSQAVDEVLNSCLLDGEENPDKVPGGVTVIPGITRAWAFRNSGLSEEKERIAAMLEDLPLQFQRTGGGGWSFLNACEDKDGKQWTGLQLQMEALCCLGIATEKAAWLVHPTLWEALPGGVPYVVIN